MGNALATEGATLGIAGNGKSTAAVYASALISDLIQLRLSDFLDR